LLAYPESVEAYRSALRVLPERNLTQAQISFKAEAQKGLHDVLGKITDPATM